MVTTVYCVFRNHTFIDWSIVYVEKPHNRGPVYNVIKEYPFSHRGTTFDQQHSLLPNFIYDGFSVNLEVYQSIRRPTKVFFRILNRL